jgi:hypothetical protein
MTAYQKYKFIVATALNSRCINRVRHRSLRIKAITVDAGLYRPNNLDLGHVFVFTSIIGKFPRIKSCQVGPRRREALRLHARFLNENDGLKFLERFISVIFPSILDMRSIKNRKRTRLVSEVGFKMRYRFGGGVPDCDELISDEMLDTRRGVFLPVNLAIQFSRHISHVLAENFIRMLRLPLTFYRWWPYPAQDDPELF